MKNKIKKLGWFDFILFLRYSGSSIFSQISFLICDFYLLKIMAVQEIGYWQYAVLIQSYVIISRMGIINSFNREFPYLKGKEDKIEAEAILTTTNFHNKITSIFQSFIFLLLCIYFYFISKPVELIALMGCMSIYTYFDSISNFKEAFLRGNLEFKKISNIKVITVIIYAGSLFLPYKFYFNGFLIRIVLFQTLQFLLFDYFVDEKIESRFSKLHWLNLFNDGWKFWLWSYLKSVNKTLPRLYLVNFSNLYYLGLFTPINWFLNASVLITTSLSNYLYPIINNRLHKYSESIGIETLFVNGIFFLTSIPFIAIFYYSLPKLVSLFLPEYSIVVKPMQITLLASIFEFILISTTIWASKRNWRYLYSIVIISILVNLAIFATINYLHPQDLLIAVSKGMFIQSFLSAMVVIGFIFKEIYIDEKETKLLSECNS